MLTMLILINVMTKSEIVIKIDLHAFTYGNVYRKNKRKNLKIVLPNI